jgi:hypothetical protein
MKIGMTVLLCAAAVARGVDAVLVWRKQRRRR